jgi:hypothetical protein
MTSIKLSSIKPSSFSPSIIRNSFGGARNFLTLGGVNEYGDVPTWTARCRR